MLRKKGHLGSSYNIQQGLNEKRKIQPRCKIGVNINICIMQSLKECCLVDIKVIC
jgi:hypothetical protein